MAEENGIPSGLLIIAEIRRANQSDTGIRMVLGAVIYCTLRGRRGAARAD
jgi:hypothetical protein